MAKRSENKDTVLLWLSEHEEAVKTDSLQPLKNAFPNERKQNLSSWRKEFIQTCSNGLKQVKKHSDTIKSTQTYKRTEPQTPPTNLNQLKQDKIDLKALKHTQTYLNQPQEINENCFYTVEQTAGLLQVDSSTVYKMIKAKFIPVLNIATAGTRGNFRILGKWLLELEPIK